jgi:hypothetical protein
MLSKVLAEQGKLPEAVAELDLALQLEPENAELQQQKLNLQAAPRSRGP